MIFLFPQLRHPDIQPRFVRAKFLPPRFFHLPDQTDCLFLVVRDHRAPVHGCDHIFPGAAVDLCKTHLLLLTEPVQKTPGQLVGIAPLAVDLHSGMSAFESADLHQKPLSLYLNLLHRDLAGKPESPGASRGQPVVLLGIQVDQHRPFEPGQINVRRAVHADLLIYRKERLHRRVFQGIAVQYGQSHGDGDAVVRPQGGVLCRHIAVLNHQFQRVREKIMV